MIQQVAFIDREEQLTVINNLVHEANSRRVLCIQAKGGIGKTRLLQKIYQDYTENDYTKTLLVANIIDFDDQAFHIPLNVEYKIAQELGENYFQPYLRALWDWRKMEAAGLSGERLSSERERTEQAFVKCFNTVSRTKRVVLLFDTLEAISQTDVWAYTLQLGLRLNNIVLIFAGRNASSFYKSLPADLKQAAQLMELSPLAPLATASYMRAKQALLSIQKPPDLLKKITWLSEGKPILIDLSIEWLARDIPLEWMRSGTLEELQSLSPHEKQTRQQEFEQQLVQQVAKTQRLIDQLTLMMSHIYPLDAALISTLLGKSESEAQELFEEAQTYAFVKSLPDGRISLHDEVRRMIHNYAWPEVDPTGGRRQWYSEKFTQYLSDQIRKTKDNIASIPTTKKDDQLLSSFMKREALERKIWVLEEQRLHHTLYSSIEQGMQVFKRLFDKATEAYRSQVRRTLLAEARKYQKALSPEQSYELAIRHAKYLFDLNAYAEAEEVLLKTLSQYTLPTLHEVELLRLLGNTKIRLGNLAEGVAKFRAARELVENMEDTPARTAKQAEVQNALGWGYRLLGQIETAIREYNSALTYAEKLGEDGLIASILNNLGYAYHLQGQKQKGRRYCSRALDKVPKSNTQQQGLIHSTLGEIHLGLENYSEASYHYEAALSCFKDISDNEGQAIVHMEISHSKRHLASIEAPNERDTLLTSALENAKASVQICERYNLRKDLPLCYYEVGRVLIDLHKFDEANFYLEKSYPQNLRREGGFALADLTALVEIAYRQKDYEKVEHWVNEIQEPETRDILLETQRADSELFHGRLLRFLAEAQLKKGQYDEALETYVQALTHIAHHGGYGAYRLDQELDRLKKHIAQLPVDIRSNWCERFIKDWQSNEDNRKHSEIIDEVRLAQI